MEKMTLVQVAVFLAAAVIAAPLAKRFNVGSVLGYLAAGFLIGPYGLGLVISLYEVDNILHFAEFGVVLLLFLIGLELRPLRLWTMRSSILGLGGAQFVVSALLLAAAGLSLGYGVVQSAFLGFAIALSSTAFALQVLEEKGELTTRHGRSAFSVLLFQDLAAIPLIALVPLFALAEGIQGEPMTFAGAAFALSTIILVVAVGHYLLGPIFRLIAGTGVREAMTAAALLTVVGVAIVMKAAGLSPVLGAFIAGALLADSEFRHQIEADIEPFKGLLLGLFFVAVGMALDLRLLAENPLRVAGLAAGIILIKALVLYGLGRWWGLDSPPARRLGLVLSQGGEFGFVLLTAASLDNVISIVDADLFIVVVTVTMAATPVLMLLDDLATRYWRAERPPYDDMPEDEGHVIVAGFGRVGQITARVLQARKIPFTAIDASSAQVDFVKKFGAKVYYGDTSRLDILRAAQAGKARAFVLALDDVNESLKTAETVRRAFPDLPIYARARDREHTHRLMDLGVEHAWRETFLSSLELTSEVLRGLGEPESEVRRLIETFRRYDERRLYEDYKHYTDAEKMQAHAKSATRELEELFAQDAEEHAKSEAES